MGKRPAQSDRPHDPQDYLKEAVYEVKLARTRRIIFYAQI
jgi:hypothetical protein